MVYFEEKCKNYDQNNNYELQKLRKRIYKTRHIIK